MRRRAGVERELPSRADQGLLRWLEHAERMEYRMASRVLMAEVSGGRARLGESDLHPISLKTPAPQYQHIDRREKLKIKRD